MLAMSLNTAAVPTLFSLPDERSAASAEVRKVVAAPGRGHMLIPMRIDDRRLVMHVHPSLALTKGAVVNPAATHIARALGDFPHDVLGDVVITEDTGAPAALSHEALRVLLLQVSDYFASCA